MQRDKNEFWEEAKTVRKTKIRSCKESQKRKMNQGRRKENKERKNEL